MTNKNELLKNLEEALLSGEVKPSEVSEILNKKPSKSHNLVSKLLYMFGGVIAIIGIVTFYFQVWDDLSSVARIVLTFGLGAIFLVLANIMSRDDKNFQLSNIFYTFSGALLPTGLFVMLSEYNVSLESYMPFVFVFGFLFVLYVIMYIFKKSFVLALFMFVFGTLWLNMILGTIIENRFFNLNDIFAYFNMLIGIVYIAIANYFSGHVRLPGILLFVGSGMISAFGFFGLVTSHGSWFSLGYFAVLAGLAFVALQLKSKGVLFVVATFLMFHLFYVTAEFFAESLSWPLYLTMFGFIVIAIGRASLSFADKYLKN